MSSYTHHVLTALSATLDRIPVEAPNGVHVLDLLAETETGAAFAGRYGDDPATELVARLDTYQKADHLDALRRLVDHLGRKRTWDLVATTKDPSCAIGRLVRDEILPADDTIFVDGSDHPELIGEVIAHQIRYRGAEGLTTSVVVAFAINNGYPGGRLLSLVRGLGTIDDGTLDRVVAHVAGDLDKIVEGLRPDNFAWGLTPEQVTRLLIDGSDAALVVAISLGIVRDHNLDLITGSPAALALYAGSDRWPAPVTEAIAANIDLLPDHLITTRAAAHIVDQVHVPDTFQLLRLLAKSQTARSWLLGNLRRNQPTVTALVEATRLRASSQDAATILSAAEILDCVPRSPLRRQADLPAALVTVPGLTAALLDALAASGKSINTLSGSHAETWAYTLEVVASVLGDDERLWERFIAAGETSPFRNPRLGLLEIRDLYLHRWAAAAARSSRR